MCVYAFDCCAGPGQDASVLRGRRRWTHALAALIAAGALAACGIRTPASIDVGALVQRRGETEARRDLALHVIEHPRDVQARLALAELADKLGRPSDAIIELEAVVSLGGPAGTRWHDRDRERLARLLLARGRERLARQAATAVADLARVRELGATVPPDELDAARIAAAVAELRHVDAKVRAKGRSQLASLRS